MRNSNIYHLYMMVFEFRYLILNILYGILKNRLIGLFYIRIRYEYDILVDFLNILFTMLINTFWKDPINLRKEIDFNLWIEYTIINIIVKYLILYPLSYCLSKIEYIYLILYFINRLSIYDIISISYITFINILKKVVLICIQNTDEKFLSIPVSLL